MSITIYRRDGSVAFVAKDATTTRKAVEAAVLNGASLDRASLDRASLNGANLNGASLDGANLNRASLNGASLYGASLDGANLYGASLDGASLYGASLYGASLSRASLNGANLDGASLNGANLYRASLNGASLDGANLNRASLDGANLYRASLSRASLNGASLNGANLSRASLDGASLYGASLDGATGINAWRTTPLLMLLDQPGPIRAYKLVAADGGSPIHPRNRITYRHGESYEVDNASTDVSEQCGAGINLATLPWVMAEWREGMRILVCEFTAADIAAIPTATDGKFRVHRCTVVGEKDLAELGLVEQEAEVAK